MALSRKSGLGILPFTFILIFPILAFGAVEKKNEPVGRATFSSAAIDWAAPADLESVMLIVRGPDGTAYADEFKGGAHPQLRVAAMKGAGDGIYVYELRAIPRISGDIKEQLKKARAAGDDATIARIVKDNNLGNAPVQSGSFTIKSGSILNPDSDESSAGANGGPSAGTSSIGGNARGPKGAGTQTDSVLRLKPAPLDQVIADDLIVQGSACVGLDCVNGESFGFDTIRLKENNTRIKFDDTSTGTGFPNTDWQLTANDSASGGLNKFSIDDVTNSKTLFTVVANGTANGIYVDNSGHVGFKTSVPALSLHVSQGDTPALRLEQTNASGFTAQTWDIAGNEANFFVRDVTGGSRLPLRIRPGAPTSSIDVSAAGNVGFQTASPTNRIDARTTDPLSDVIASFSTSPATLGMSLGYAGLSYGRGASFFNAVGDASTASPNPSLRFLTAFNLRMIIDNNGNIGIGGVGAPGFPIEHSSGAKLTAGGVWTNASSCEAKTNIGDLSSREASQALRGLQPVKFFYKVDMAEPHVGFIAEDVPDLVATPDRKGLSSMDIVAVLTRVVKDQQETIEQLNTRLQQLEAKQKD